MNSKISDKDKKDWENFLSDKTTLPNKDLDKSKKKLTELNFMIFMDLPLMKQIKELKN